LVQVPPDSVDLQQTDWKVVMRCDEMWWVGLETLRPEV
jgi:hypothetical protein